MKNGWQAQRLDDVCMFRPPKSEARERLSSRAPVSFFGMEDLGIDEKYPQSEHVRKLDEVAGSYTYFAEGDVLLAKITPCFQNGKLGIAKGLKNGIGFGSSEFIVARPSPVLDREYLYYFLSRDEFRSEGVLRMGGAVGQQRIPNEFVQGQLILLPPLPEQRRIVGILDEAFAGIATAKANAEKNLQNARAIFESWLNAVFAQRGEGWVERPLRDYVEDVSTGPFGSLLHKSDYEHGEIPLINPINIEGGQIIPDARKAVGTATAKRLIRYALRKNDIVIGRRGEIGRCAVVTGDQAGWLCGTGCFFIRPSEMTDPRFLTHLLRSRPYRGKLEGVAARATMPSISNDDLANLVIGLPPLPQQRRTLTLLESFSTETQRLESLYQRKLAALDELKKSLLHQAFSGQL